MLSTPVALRQVAARRREHAEASGDPLLNAVARFVGSPRAGLAIGVVSQATLFGLLHLYQGTLGFVMAAFFALIYGIAYLAIGRNLWPLVIVHGSAVAHIADSYKRYLENTFRKAFELVGTPLRVQFKQGDNPFADKKPGPKSESDEKRDRNQRRRGRKLYGKKY